MADMSSPLRLGILGSCVSRDMASLHQDCSVVLYIARQSLISATSPAVQPPSPIELSSPFQRRMVADDLASKALSLLEDHAAELDMLVLDLVDERLGVVPLGKGTFATDSQELKASGTKAALSPVGPDIELGSPNHFSLWSAAARRVVQELGRIGLLDRTVVLMVPFAGTGSDGGPVPGFMGRSASDWNTAYRPYYALIEELGLPLVRLPAALAVSDPGHRWGLSPYHFVDDAYTWLMREARSVLGRDNGDVPGSEARRRRVPVPLSLPVAGIKNPALGGAIRFPLDLRVDVKRWRLRVTVRDRRSRHVPKGSVELTGLWSGPEGAPGCFISPPAQLMHRRRLPENGQELVTPWFDAPIAPGRSLVAVGWRADSPTSVTLSLADAYRGPDEDAAAVSGTAGFIPSRYVPLSWTLELDVDASVPVLVAWGDEFALGSQPASALANSALTRRAHDMGGLAVHVVHPGTGLALWHSYRRQWDDTVLGFPADEVFHGMGIRDLLAGASVNELTRLFLDTLPRLIHSHGRRVSSVLLDETIELTKQQALVRASFNAWLLSAFPGTVYRLENHSYVRLREPLEGPDRGLTSVPAIGPKRGMTP